MLTSFFSIFFSYNLIFIKNNYNFYESFQNSLKKLENLYVIDLLSEFLKHDNFEQFYSDDNEYGGHLSKEGNEFVANIIHSKLDSLKL